MFPRSPSNLKTKFKGQYLVATLLLFCNPIFSIDQNYFIYTDQSDYTVKGMILSVYDSTFNEASDAIDYAIQLAPSNGGQICFQPGNYYLNKAVKLKDKLKITGSGIGTRFLITPENETGIGILCEKSKGVSITDMLISANGNKNSVAGIVFDNCGNSTVSNVICAGFSKYGIWVKNESFLCLISESSFAGNEIANIFFDKHRWGEWGDFVPNTVSNSMIYGGGKGILGIQTTVLNIVDCSFYQTSGAAISMEQDCYSVLVSGCRTFQTKGDAVYFDSSGEINISSNIFCWQTGNGIVIKNCGWGVVSGNEIIDNGSFNPNAKDRTKIQPDFPGKLGNHYGIWLSNARGINLSGNTIFNWPQAGKMKIGIFEDYMCYENVISNNIINYYHEKAILSKGKKTLIRNNMKNADKAYEGNPNEEVIQSFQEDLIEKFINILK